jgi:signal transduction histidine kinase
MIDGDNKELEFNYYQRLRVGALFAGLSAGALYMLLALLSFLMGTQSVVDVFRIIISMFIVVYSAAFYVMVSGKVVFSDVFVAISSLLFSLTIPLLTYLAARFDASLMNWLTTSLIIGLFLHYSVLNLRAGLSLVVGFFSTAVAVGFVIIQGGSDVARILVFLSMANFVGYYVGRKSMESENAEVLARLQMKRSWAKLRAMRTGFKEDVLEHKRWVGGFSHELNQPLFLASKIITDISAEVVREAIDRKELAALVKEAESQLRDVNAMFDVLVKQAQSPHETMNVNLSWVSVADVLQEALAHIDQGSLTTKKHIRFECDDTEGLQVYTDLYLFKRVLRNVLENSIRFSMSDHPRAFFRASFDEVTSRLVIRVFNKINAGEGESTAGLHFAERGEFSFLGLGLGFGRTFLARVNSAVPGQRTKVKVKKNRFALVKITFSDGFALRRIEAASSKDALGANGLTLFSDNRILVGECASLVAKIGVGLKLRGIGDLVSEFCYDHAPNCLISPPVYIIEVSQAALSPVDYFGVELYEKMLCQGSYVFVSNFRLDRAYERLGLCVLRDSLDVETIEKLCFR